MTQLICPLCGRFVSLNFFDPSGFEHDILGVDTVGLGRGRGTRVVDKFSLLDDSELMGTIRDRCLLLVRIIGGKSPPDQKDLAALQREVESWRKKALDEHKDGSDLMANIADMESDLRYWQGEAMRLDRLNGDYESKIADMESSLRRWQGEARRLKKLVSDYEVRIAEDESIVRSWMNHSHKLSDEVKALRSEKKRLRFKIKSMEEQEMIAIEEMEDLLEYVNEQTNETFESLEDAIGFLLEVG